MSTAAHTPGPWRLCYDGQIDGADGTLVVALPFESYRDFTEMPDRVKANYRAMTAAPDLLLLLKVYWNGKSFLPVSDGDCAAINACIAKATGAAA